MAKNVGNPAKSNKNIFQKIGGFFYMLKEKVAHNKLYVLTIMQLKDKWNFSWKTNKKATLFKLVGYILIFAAMIFLVHLVLDLSATKLGIFMTKKIPFKAMLPILLVVIVFETVSILFGLTKSLFFSKDNGVLITYPVKFDYLFVSKILVYYVDALKKSCMLMLPLFISFGIIYNYGVAYYFYVIFLDIVFVGFLVLLCGVLAIPSYYFVRFLEKFKIIKYIFSISVLGLLVYGTVLLIKAIPSNINLIRQYESFYMNLNKFLYWFGDHFKITRYLGCMFFGVSKNLFSMAPFSKYSIIVPGILIGIIAVLVVINIFLAKPFYRRTISSSSKGSSTTLKHKKNHRHTKWGSVLRYEFIRNFRDEKLIISSIVCVVAMPLISLFVNRFYGSFKTKALGDTLIYIFNFVFIMIVATSHNVSSSYIFSKDGPSWSINKTMPISPRRSLSMRLVYNLLVSALIIIPSSIIFFQSPHAKGKSVVLFIFVLLILSTFHSVVSASYDFSHSENKDKADIGSEIVENHTAISLALGFVMIIFIGFFIAICALQASSHAQLRLLFLSIFMLALGIVYFLRKIHLTYQEN